MSEGSISKIQNVLIDLNFSEAAKSVTPDADLFEAGALDSLSLIQFVIEVEQAFQVRIPNEKITYENFKTFKHINELIGAQSQS